MRDGRHRGGTARCRRSRCDGKRRTGRPRRQPISARTWLTGAASSPRLARVFFAGLGLLVRRPLWRPLAGLRRPLPPPTRRQRRGRCIRIFFFFFFFFFKNLRRRVIRIVAPAQRSCASTSSKYSLSTSTSRGLPPRRRHEAVGLHHVDEPRGAAEADPQPPLEVRDRRLAALHDDARGLVVEIVLLELALPRSRSSLRGDRRRRRPACPACAGSSRGARSPVPRCRRRADA